MKKVRTTKEPNQMTKWIVNLPPSKTLLIFGLFLPMYSIWLRHVGLFAIRQNGREDKIFSVLSLSFVIAVFMIFIGGYWFQLAKHEIPAWIHFTIPLSLITILFICNGIASKNMIDYENRHNEYFSGFTHTMKEYVFRFFHLFYFPFSIYWLQKDVNQYLNNEAEGRNNE